VPGAVQLPALVGLTPDHSLGAPRCGDEDGGAERQADGTAGEVERGPPQPLGHRPGDGEDADHHHRKDPRFERQDGRPLVRRDLSVEPGDQQGLRQPIRDLRHEVGTDRQQDGLGCHAGQPKPGDRGHTRELPGEAAAPRHSPEERRTRGVQQQGDAGNEADGAVGQPARRQGCLQVEVCHRRRRPEQAREEQHHGDVGALRQHPARLRGMRADRPVHTCRGTLPGRLHQPGGQPGATQPGADPQREGDPVAHLREGRSQPGCSRPDDVGRAQQAADDAGVAGVPLRDASERVVEVGLIAARGEAVGGTGEKERQHDDRQ